MLSEAFCRNNLLRSSTRLRKIISSPAFEGLFGEAKPQPKGGRSNIFGREDELKVAPKGVAKDHKYDVLFLSMLRRIPHILLLSRDIDLLKCRSFAVMYQYVFKSRLLKVYLELYKVH